MSKQRLSKLQKWVLINCYKVTVLKDRNDLQLKKIKNNTHINHDDDFYKEDIYMGYFNLEIDSSKTCFESVAHFVESYNSHTAWVSTCRVLKLLRDKGLIVFYSPLGTYSTHVILTDGGKAVAEFLIDKDNK